MPVISSSENTLQERFVQRLMQWGKLLITPKAYSAAALVGGLLLITYYASIRFLPDLDLSSTLWILVCIALVGALILAVFGSALAMPGVFWLTMLAESSATPPADSRRNRHLARSFLLQFLLPLWAVMVVSLAISIVLRVSIESRGLSVLILIGPLLLWPTGPALYICFKRTAPGVGPSDASPAQMRKRSHRFERAFLFWLVGLASWAAWLAALLFISGEILSTSVENQWQYILYAACIYLWIAFANLIIVFMSKKPIDPAGSAPGIGLESVGGVACCVLILVFLAPSYLPQVVVRGLGLGAIENATLLIDERGKAILAEARRNHCGRPEDPPNGLSGVTLLNVLGTRLLVACADRNESYRFTVAKEVVLSWSTRQPLR